MSEDSKPGSEQGGRKQDAGISALGRKVAGIDVGSKGHWVCAPAREGEGREVKVFGATPPELEKMAAWLLERGVESAALESTGVDSGPRSVREPGIGSAAGGYAVDSPSAGADEDGSTRLRMDPTAA